MCVLYTTMKRSLFYKYIFLGYMPPYLPPRQILSFFFIIVVFCKMWISEFLFLLYSWYISLKSTKTTSSFFFTNKFIVVSFGYLLFYVAFFWKNIVRCFLRCFYFKIFECLLLLFNYFFGLTSQNWLNLEACFSVYFEKKSYKKLLFLSLHTVWQVIIICN